MSIVRKALKRGGIDSFLTIQDIPDQIPLFPDLNHAFAYTQGLSERYRENDILIFWNTGETEYGGCGGTGGAPYIYFGLPTPWTPLRTAGKLMHEIGHAYGLPHSDSPISVMGPNVNNLTELNYSDEEWWMIYFYILYKRSYG